MTALFMVGRSVCYVLEKKILFNDVLLVRLAGELCPGNWNRASKDIFSPAGFLHLCCCDVISLEM